MISCLLIAPPAEVNWLAKLLEKKPDDLAVLGLRVAITIVVGLVLARVLSGLFGRIAARRGSAQGEMITRRFVFYAILGLAFFMVLDTLGVQLSVLLGAAGILTVALGFASQTSASNLISGLFLLGERPFSLGDTVEVGGTTGVVLSVDLLSVKLRTFDNIYVRVPNETLIKSEIKNLSRNPIRRIEINLRLAYDEDIERVRELLRAVADEDPEMLEEPEPAIWVDALGDSAIHVRFLVWTANDSRFFFKRSRIQERVTRALREHEVAIGYQKVAVGGAGERGAAAAAEVAAQGRAPKP